MLSFLRPPANARVQPIDPREAVRRAGAGEITVIDVRDGAELAMGRAEGALHVPLMALKMKCDPSSPECLAALDVEKPVALYCASGARSRMAGQMLADMGYAEVYNIGGLGDWHAGGGRVVR